MAERIDAILPVEASSSVERVEEVRRALEQKVDDLPDAADRAVVFERMEEDLTLARRQIDVLMREELVQRQDILQREDILARQEPAQLPLDPVRQSRSPAEREIDPAQRDVDPSEREIDPAQRAIDPANRERALDQIQRNFDVAQDRAAERIEREENYVPDAVVDQGTKY